MEHRPNHLGHRSAVIWLADAGWQALWAITACTALANGAYIALFTGFGPRVRHALLFALAYVVRRPSPASVSAKARLPSPSGIMPNQSSATWAIKFSRFLQQQCEPDSNRPG
jgi:hypothetical protein